jgi:hypothetical protein
MARKTAAKPAAPAVTKPRTTRAKSERIADLGEAWEAAYAEATERAAATLTPQAIADAAAEAVALGDSVQIITIDDTPAQVTDERTTAVTPYVHEGTLQTDDEDDDPEDPPMDDDDEYAAHCATYTNPPPPATRPLGPTVIKAAKGGQAVAIPARYLATALLCSETVGWNHRGTNGVFVHAVDGDLRVAATDGKRLIVSRAPTDKALPEWAADGVLIPRDLLVRALPLLESGDMGDIEIHGKDWQGKPYTKVETRRTGLVMVEYGTGHKNVTLRAYDGTSSFTRPVVDAKFPDYALVFESQAAVLARDGCEALEASAIGTVQLTAIAAIARRLKAEAVHAFVNSDEKDAMFFTFEGAPDSVLVVMPYQGKGPSVPDGVVRILGDKAMTGSLAAFRAHLTRARNALQAKGISADERKRLELRANTLENRIESIAQVLSSARQIEHKVAA